MKILFFLAHPAHYHLFKNSIKYFISKNAKPIIVIKSKDILEKILQEEKINYTNIFEHEKKKESKLGLLFEAIKGLIIRDFKLLRIVLKNKPNLMIGTDWSIAHIGFITKIPSIITNEDDTIATPENKYFYPFAKNLLLPSCCDKKMWGKKRITYNSYHEFAYLHPNNFTPDKEVIKSFNSQLDPFVIMRLVKLTASHDIGKMGLSEILIDQIIEKVSIKYRIFITSEKPLNSKYEKYRISLNPIDIHHALYYAELFIGDSQTMSAEAGVLGTPFIRYSDFVGKIGYLNELENIFHLGFGFKIDESQKLIDQLDKLLLDNNLKEKWLIRKNKLLSEKINFADLLTWILENYPKSVQIMKENPDFQYNFK